MGRNGSYRASAAEAAIPLSAKIGHCPRSYQGSSRFAGGTMERVKGIDNKPPWLKASN